MAKSKNEVAIDRRATDRRANNEDRRKQEITVAIERRTLANAERRKTPRRRQIDPTTCERDYSPDEVEFMNAMNDYKRKSGRMFPTCSEILEVIRNLGYVRATPANPIAPIVALPTVPVCDSTVGA